MASIAFDEASETVWATSHDGGTLTSIDVLTGGTRTVSLGRAVTSVTAHDGRVLVGMARSPAEVVAALEETVLRMGTDEPFAEADPAYGDRSGPRRPVGDHLRRIRPFGACIGPGRVPIIPDRTVELDLVLACPA